jgi:hypothetical protein
MCPGEIHGEADKRPWEREESYLIPKTRMGRPDLPGIEAEIEGVLRLIGTLPKLIGWWPGQSAPMPNAYEVAYEVQNLLSPRITSATLGRPNLYVSDTLWGTNYVDRCSHLCLPHPTDEGWELVRDRTLLFAGERARHRLRRNVVTSANEAMEELNKHWLHSPELMSR